MDMARHGRHEHGMRLKLAFEIDLLAEVIAYIALELKHYWNISR